MIHSNFIIQINDSFVLSHSLLRSFNSFILESWTLLCRSVFWKLLCKQGGWSGLNQSMIIVLVFLISLDFGYLILAIVSFAYELVRLTFDWFSINWFISQLVIDRNRVLGILKLDWLSNLHESSVLISCVPVLIDEDYVSRYVHMVLAP